MELRQLGQSDLRITPVGFGTWAIGGSGWRFSWGPTDDQESVSALHRALDLGINWIDTAAVYGLGHSEEIVARALAGRASRPYVFTKCGRTADENGNIGGALKAASIRRECEASLRRLGCDVIDLYQMHWPDPDEDIEEGWTAMAELQTAGKVRWIGVSNFNAAQLERARRIAPITSLQPPYSMLRRGIEAEILPYCQRHGIGVIVYSPMLSGMLAGGMTAARAAQLPASDWRRNSKEFQEPRLARNLALVEELRAVGARYHRAPGEVAIAWTLRHSAVTGAIVGARRPAQIEALAGALDFRLTDADFRMIDEALARNAQA